MIPKKRCYAEASHPPVPLNLLALSPFVAPLWRLLSIVVWPLLMTASPPLPPISPRIDYEAHDHCQGDDPQHPLERNDDERKYVTYDTLSLHRSRCIGVHTLQHLHTLLTPPSRRTEQRSGRGRRSSHYRSEHKITTQSLDELSITEP